MKRLLGTTELPELIQTRVAFPSSSSVVTVCSAVVISFPFFPIQVAHSHADRVSQSATTQTKRRSKIKAQHLQHLHERILHIYSFFTSCSSSIFYYFFFKGGLVEGGKLKRMMSGGLRLPTQERGEPKNRSKGARNSQKDVRDVKKKTRGEPQKAHDLYRPATNSLMVQNLQ